MSSDGEIQLLKKQMNSYIDAFTQLQAKYLDVHERLVKAELRVTQLEQTQRRDQQHAAVIESMRR